MVTGSAMVNQSGIGLQLLLNVSQNIGMRFGVDFAHEDFLGTCHGEGGDLCAQGFLGARNFLFDLGFGSRFFAIALGFGRRFRFFDHLAHALFGLGDDFIGAAACLCNGFIGLPGGIFQRFLAFLGSGQAV